MDIKHICKFDILTSFRKVFKLKTYLRERKCQETAEETTFQINLQSVLIIMEIKHQIVFRLFNPSKQLI